MMPQSKLQADWHAENIYTMFVGLQDRGFSREESIDIISAMLRNES